MSNDEHDAVDAAHAAELDVLRARLAAAEARFDQVMTTLFEVRLNAERVMTQRDAALRARDNAVDALRWLWDYVTGPTHSWVDVESFLADYFDAAATPAPGEEGQDG